MKYETEFFREKSTRISPIALLFLLITIPFFSNRDASADAFTNVPEAADYTLIYQIELPVNAAPGYNSSGVPYTIDNSENLIGPFDRVAYYLQLDNNWIFVSMDPFTCEPGKIGIPATATGTGFQQNVTRMNVSSNVGGIVTGTNISSGNIEFFPNSYSANNILGVPNANNIDFDWGDQISAGGYGSMQIHNHGASQVLFALNGWGETNLIDLGIGNNVTPNRQDWTLANNAGSYTTRTLQVLARVNEATVYQNILQANDYQLVYSLHLEDNANYSASEPAWCVNNSASITGSFERIAYYLEYEDALRPTYIFASMDAFTQDLTQMGVPTFGSGAVFQQKVEDMDVFSNGIRIFTGEDWNTGNIEFWPTSYNATNSLSIPNANGSTFDYGDERSLTGNYGSMQIHNHDVGRLTVEGTLGQVLFAYNNWNTGSAGDLGIGNDNLANIDWTGTAEAPTYTTKTMHILVLPLQVSGVTVTESIGNTQVSESGQFDTFDVELDSQPTTEVQIILTPNSSHANDIDLGAGPGTSITLTFDDLTWNIPQTVTVSAIDDSIPEFIETAILNFATSSTQPAFHNLDVPSLTVRIEDNEPSRKLKLYFLAGQSNANGQGSNSDLPVELNKTFNNIKIYNTTPLNSHSGWRDLEPGFGQTLNQFGPELSFANTLQQLRPNEVIGIIKYAPDASFLDPEWLPFDVHYLGIINSIINAFLSAEHSLGNVEPEIAGMLWMQGEFDAVTIPTANAYEQNLTDFIGFIRAETFVTSMPFVIGQIANNGGVWPFGATVQQAQLDVAANVFNTKMFITSDIGIKPDNVHYSSAGNIELGNRFANCINTLLPPANNSPQFLNIDNTICMETGTSIPFTYIAVMDDEDPIGSLTASVTQVSSGILAQVQLDNGTSELSMSIDLNPGVVPGIYPTGITVEDSQGTSSTLLVDVHVIDENSTPVFLTTGSFVVSQGATDFIALNAATISDDCPLDDMTVGITNTPSSMTISITNFNEATGRIDAEISVGLTVPAGNYFAEITTTDTFGSAVSASFEITVDTFNSPPQILTIFDIAEVPGATNTSRFLGTIIDAEESPATLNVQIQNVPAGITVVPQVNLTTGDIFLQTTVLPSVATGSYNLTLSVQDTGGLNASSPFRINIIDQPDFTKANNWWHLLNDE